MARTKGQGRRVVSWTSVEAEVQRAGWPRGYNHTLVLECGHTVMRRYPQHAKFMFSDCPHMDCGWTKGRSKGKEKDSRMKQLNQEQQQKLNGVIAQAALGGLGGMTEPATATLGVAVDTAALMAELARLRAENEALRVSGQRRISFKVSEKGAVSVYGLGAYPQTLYEEQWMALLDKAEELKAFIAKAKAAGLLATPEQKAARKAEAKAQREAQALAAKTKA